MSPLVKLAIGGVGAGVALLLGYVSGTYLGEAVGELVASHRDVPLPQDPEVPEEVVAIDEAAE